MMFPYRSLSLLSLLVASIWTTTSTAWQPSAKHSRRGIGRSATTLTWLSKNDYGENPYPRGISSPDVSSSSFKSSSTTAAGSGSSSSSLFSNAPPPFLMQAFSECDDTNRPPSLNLLLRSLQQLSYSGSDVRGRFTDHARLGTVASVAHAIGRHKLREAPPLTPLAAFCFGHGLATLLIQQQQFSPLAEQQEEKITIVIGRDPRPHGTRLADSLARGALSVDSRIQVYYTGLATTPACAYFAQSGQADAAVMVTASHLPEDRNGFKVFIGQQTTTKADLMRLGTYAMECAAEWYTRGILPPSSGSEAVHCTDWVDWMPLYKQRLADAFGLLIRGRSRQDGDDDSTLLQGLTLVLNSGHGSGGFFQDVLASLGADVSGSIHVEPDGTFPVGVPNPEYNLESDTVKACQAKKADLGIVSNIP